MSKLTKAQRRMLQSVADEQVARHFDVWGGYSWTERGKRLAAYGKSANFPPLPIRYLLDQKLIHLAADERVASGAHIARYYVTPAGRAVMEPAP